MRFKAEGISDLCIAARALGNGAAGAETIAALIAAAKKTSPGELLRDLVAHAKRNAEKYQEPALRLERWARIAGLTGDERDFHHAIDLVPKVFHRCARARAKKLIVQAYVAAGELGKARDFAVKIKSAYWGAEAWVGVTEGSKDANDLERAKLCCKDINDPLAKEEVEAQIRALRV